MGQAQISTLVGPHEGTLGGQQHVLMRTASRQLHAPNGDLDAVKHAHKIWGQSGETRVGRGGFRCSMHSKGLHVQQRIGREGEAHLVVGADRLGPLAFQADDVGAVPREAVRKIEQDRG
eukprot:scaffold13187_cov112-Isochrysis_galbana.AAC.2